MSRHNDAAKRLFSVLYEDALAFACLKAVQEVGPDDAYIAAGFVRNRYWDQLYDNNKAILAADIDVIYFDPDDATHNVEHAFEAALSSAVPDQQWQVRNQARMHEYGGHSPFKDLNDALMHWPEVATAIGVRMTNDDALEYIAPFGLDDLYDHVLRITPLVKEKDPSAFEKRLINKGWRKRWPQLRVIRA
ncbi:nucleotidyltransferase family protein [Kordiimonas aquimaris]|uniref:nucleotidyltransferase family protein n=1 Tax=Kordiimonas aquimaris TaxID=707591 RepID=UPI0021CEBBDD|nr:nucleotidyltransferase family protein [Kordiimonas aquimaris]